MSAKVPSTHTADVHLKRVADSVTNVRIRRTVDTGRPIASFLHTDFVDPIDPQLVEDMAISLISSGVPFDKCDVIVSVADRISGSLAHALSRITGKPYSLANWYPVGSPGDIEIEPSRGFAGSGMVYLNGLEKGQKVVFLDDSLFSGATAGNLIEGCRKAGTEVLHAAFVVEVLEGTGRHHEKLQGVPLTSLVTIYLRGERTKVQQVCPLVAPMPEVKPVPTLRDIRNLSYDTLASYKAEIEATFVGIPIVRNPHLAYPYSFFQLTDFKPIMTADIVEKMADLCVYYSDMTRCDILVSEADRGGGPLVHACAQRLNMKYVMATWSTSVAVVNSADAQVGFSGVGKLYVNGITKGLRCAFVDDMLSSGGTAEGVLKAVESAGGIPVEGVFISEKLYPERIPRKGLERLKKTWPYLSVTCVVQFVADGEVTQAAPKSNLLASRT